MPNTNYKRAIIRSIWGMHPNDKNFNQTMKQWNVTQDLTKLEQQRLTSSTNRMYSGIYHHLNETQYHLPIKIYVYGQQNYNMMVNLGLKNDTIMIDSKPYIHHPELHTQSYWHKLDIMNYAMNVDHYDEIIFLDWDCYLMQPYDEQFIWQQVNQKESFQACLFGYKRSKIRYRTRHESDPGNSNHYVPNAGFVYMRNKDFPQEMQKMTESWSEEAAMAKWLDCHYGEWIGIHNYFNLHEPIICNLHRMGSVFRYIKKSIAKQNPTEVPFVHNLHAHRNIEQLTELSNKILKYRQ